MKLDMDTKPTAANGIQQKPQEAIKWTVFHANTLKPSIGIFENTTKFMDIKML